MSGQREADRCISQSFKELRNFQLKMTGQKGHFSSILSVTRPVIRLSIVNVLAIIEIVLYNWELRIVRGFPSAHTRGTSNPRLADLQGFCKDKNFLDFSSNLAIIGTYI